MMSFIAYPEGPVRGALLIDPELHGLLERASKRRTIPLSINFGTGGVDHPLTITRLASPGRTQNADARTARHASRALHDYILRNPFRTEDPIHSFTRDVISLIATLHYIGGRIFIDNGAIDLQDPSETNALQSRLFRLWELLPTGTARGPEALMDEAAAALSGTAMGLYGDRIACSRQDDVVAGGLADIGTTAASEMENALRAFRDAVASDAGDPKQIRHAELEIFDHVHWRGNEGHCIASALIGWSKTSSGIHAEEDMEAAVERGWIAASARISEPLLRFCRYLTVVEGGILASRSLPSDPTLAPAGAPRLPADAIPFVVVRRAPWTLDPADLLKQPYPQLFAEMAGKEAA